MDNLHCLHLGPYNNTYPGIPSGSVHPRDNAIWNNQFFTYSGGTTEPSVSIHTHCESPENCANIWSAEKTPGVNILGGPFLGGNYWEDYRGEDEDMDGLGDEPYVIDQINRDFAPLIMPAILVLHEAWMTPDRQSFMIAPDEKKTMAALHFRLENRVEEGERDDPIKVASMEFEFIGGSMTPVETGEAEEPYKTPKMVRDLESATLSYFDGYTLVKLATLNFAPDQEDINVLRFTGLDEILDETIEPREDRQYILEFTIQKTAPNLAFYGAVLRPEKVIAFAGETIERAGIEGEPVTGTLERYGSPIEINTTIMEKGVQVIATDGQLDYFYGQEITFTATAPEDFIFDGFRIYGG
jgi:hypothetical protein